MTQPYRLRYNHDTLDWETVLLNLVEFTPRIEGPLIVELVEYLRDHEGIIMSVDWGVWDFIGSTPTSDEPQVALKTVRNTIPLPTIDEITSSSIPIKLLLVEGYSPDIAALEMHALLLANTGTGVYVRNYGWFTLPAWKPTLDPEEVALMRSPSWRKWSDGVWRKQCTTCGEHKTPDEFYRSGVKYGTDPYRGDCKACNNLMRTARRRAASGLTAAPPS